MTRLLTIALILVATAGCEPDRPIVSQANDLSEWGWTKSGKTFDGCPMDYFWKGYGRMGYDTCCLDSVVYDNYGYKSYWSEYIRDSTGRVVEVKIIPDSAISPY